MTAKNSLNKSTLIRRVLLFVTLFAGLFALMPDASAAGIFDTFSNAFQTATQGWFGKAQGYANDIFYTLLAADFVWLALTWVLSRKTFDEILPGLIRKAMVYGFFLFLLVNAGTFLPAIINSFIQIGTGVSGVPALTPSTLIDVGDSLAYGIFTGDYSDVQRYVPGATVPAAPSTSGSNATTSNPTGGTNAASSGASCGWNPLCYASSAANAVGDTISSALNKIIFFFIALIFAGITWVAFLLMAIDLLITLIESYVVLGIGVVFLGFGGSRWTTKFADGILNYAVSVGVKLMVLYLVIGTLISAVVPAVVSQLMVNVNSGTGALQSLLLGGAGVILMMMLSKSIPSKAQSLLSGAASLGGAHAIREGTQAAAAVGGAAMMAAGPAGLAAGLAKKGMSAVSKATGGSISGGEGGSNGVAAPLGKKAGQAVGQGLEKAGQAAGKGIDAAGQAAGKGVQSAGKAAGAAISAIPIPGVAQAAGAAVSAASTVAGKGIEVAGKTAGKGVELAGKAAGKGAEVAGEATGKGVDAASKGIKSSFSATKDAAKSSPAGSAPQGTESADVKAPSSGGLKSREDKESAPRRRRSGNTGQNMQQILGMAQHHGGSVQASHISTGHGND